MSIGNFKDTNENNDVRETTEDVDNSEKKRNQILETPESYNDDFESKLDSNKREFEKDSGSSEKDSEQKNSLLEKMKNLFSKKENGEDTSLETTSQEKEKTSQRDSFRDDLKKDVLSYEEQAAEAQELPGRDEYLAAREKSEQAKKDYPDKKDWELSPEGLKDVQKGQAEVANNINDSGHDDKKETDEDRTPGGDAYARRFGHIENE